MKRHYKGCSDHNVSRGAFAITARDINVHYKSADRAALCGLNVSIEKGKRVALVGANGAGKSTFLKLAAGLISSYRGVMEVFGHAPGGCNHQVAYVPQKGRIDWSFPVTLEKFVLSGRYVHLGWFTRPGKSDYALLNETLDLLRLEPLRQRSIGDLSGGEQQRALLARALIHDASLLLLDEPMNAVDVKTRSIIEELLDKLQASGNTVVMATHDIGKLDKQFDAVIYLNEGSVVEG